MTKCHRGYFIFFGYLAGFGPAAFCFTRKHLLPNPRDELQTPFVKQGKKRKRKTELPAFQQWWI